MNFSVTFNVWCYIFKTSNKLESKINSCGHDNRKSVCGGTKSSVSISDEKVQANQDRVYFLAFVFVSYHKK